MATIISITQGYATDNGTRKPNKVWKVINTTLEDERQLMIAGFLPLIIHDDLIPDHMKIPTDEAFARFFNKGMFLLEENLTAINNALDAIGYQPVILKEDGKYFQPTLPGKYKPCAKSWKNNAVCRSKEMKEIMREYKQDKKIDLTPYEKISYMLTLVEELQASTDEGIEAAGRIYDNLGLLATKLDN